MYKKGTTALESLDSEIMRYRPGFFFSEFKVDCMIFFHFRFKLILIKYIFKVDTIAVFFTKYKLTSITKQKITIT